MGLQCGKNLIPASTPEWLKSSTFYFRIQTKVRGSAFAYPSTTINGFIHLLDVTVPSF